MGSKFCGRTPHTHGEGARSVGGDGEEGEEYINLCGLYHMDGLTITALITMMLVLLPIILDGVLKRHDKMEARDTCIVWCSAAYLHNT